MYSTLELVLRDGLNILVFILFCQYTIISIFSLTPAAPWLLPHKTFDAPQHIFSVNKHRELLETC